MAKTISIDLSHVFTSGRGEEESVKDALRWLADHMSETDEESGEETIPFTPADLIVYAVRRLRALHKDNKRYGSGKLANRYYAPRLDNVKDGTKVARKLAQGVTLVHEAAERPAKAPARKPTRKATAK
jgi:hypothetical protein